MSNNTVRDGQEKEKVIVIMLDVQGTLEGINEENCNIFIRQLNVLRQQFDATKAIINVSSHIYDLLPIKNLTDIIKKNLRDGIIFNDISLFGAVYHYDTDIMELKGFGYNSSKTQTFEDNYLNQNNYNVVWFGIVDDDCSPSYIDRFRNKQPMIVCRPSQKENSLKYNNLMCYNSLTQGFEGTIDCLQQYIKRIDSLTIDEIMKQQKNMMRHLSSLEVTLAVLNKKYRYLINYIKLGLNDDDDFENIAKSISEDNIGTLSSNSLLDLKELIELLQNYLDKDNKYLKLLIGY